MTPTQIVSLLSISIVTFCLVFLTIWIVRILKSFQQTILKTNLILEDAKSITQNISEPVTQIHDFFIGIKEGINLVSSFFNK